VYLAGADLQSILFFVTGQARDSGVNFTKKAARFFSQAAFSFINKANVFYFNADLYR
jgi:hypothetical protein